MEAKWTRTKPRIGVERVIINEYETLFPQI